MIRTLQLLVLGMTVMTVSCSSSESCASRAPKSEGHGGAVAL